MIEIDAHQLKTFADALTHLSRRQTPHRVLDDLTDAVRIPCLVMLERAGRGVVFSRDSRTARLVEEIGATMPR
jgi:hypothetical protein